MVFHVFNRGVGRRNLFDKAGDFEAGQIKVGQIKVTGTKSA